MVKICFQLVGSLRYFTHVIADVENETPLDFSPRHDSRNAELDCPRACCRCPSRQLRLKDHRWLLSSAVCRLICNENGRLCMQSPLRRVKARIAARSRDCGPRFRRSFVVSSRLLEPAASHSNAPGISGRCPAADLLLINMLSSQPLYKPTRILDILVLVL